MEGTQGAPPGHSTTGKNKALVRVNKELCRQLQGMTRAQLEAFVLNASPDALKDAARSLQHVGERLYKDELIPLNPRGEELAKDIKNSIADDELDGIDHKLDDYQAVQAEAQELKSKLTKIFSLTTLLSAMWKKDCQMEELKAAFQIEAEFCKQMENKMKGEMAQIIAQLDEATTKIRELTAKVGSLEGELDQVKQEKKELQKQLAAEKAAGQADALQNFMQITELTELKDKLEIANQLIAKQGLEIEKLNERSTTRLALGSLGRSFNKISSRFGGRVSENIMAENTASASKDGPAEGELISF